MLLWCRQAPYYATYPEQVYNDQQYSYSGNAPPVGSEDVSNTTRQRPVVNSYSSAGSYGGYNYPGQEQGGAYQAGNYQG